MNDELQELQRNELEALQAIFMDDFERVQVKTAWKAVATLPEFRIRITPTVEHLKRYISVFMHVQLLRTYPNVAPEIRLEDPQGIAKDRVQALQRALKDATAPLLGGEMIYELASLAQERVTQMAEQEEKDGSVDYGTKQLSFYDQMVNRTERASKLEEQREKERATREQRQAHRIEYTEARELARKVEEELARKALQLQRVQAQQTASSSGYSTPVRRQSEEYVVDQHDATARANVIRFDAFITVEHMNTDCSFRAVDVGHSIGKGVVGSTFAVQPLPASGIQGSLPLLAMKQVNIENNYYLLADGKRQLQVMEKELARLEHCRHANLVPIYASKLSRNANGWRLHILMAYEAGGTVADLLRRCGAFRLPLVLDFARQVLSAMAHLHASNFVHKDIRCSNVFVHDELSGDTTLRLGDCSFARRLLDMHLHNSLSPTYPAEPSLQRCWTPPELLERPGMYSRKSDIWQFGVMIVAMLWGIEILERDSEGGDITPSAIVAEAPAPIQQLLNSIFQSDPRQRPTALDLLYDPVFKQNVSLRGNTLLRRHPDTHNPVLTLLEAANQPEMSTAGSVLGQHSSPIKSTLYGVSPLDAMVYQSLSTTSRYLADFEVIEFLGKGGFGEVVKARNKLDGRFYAIKKVRLDPLDTEENRNIRREITTLSRLHHQYVVRYYTSWIEDQEGVQWDTSDEDVSDSDETADDTSDDIEFGRRHQKEPGDSAASMSGRSPKHSRTFSSLRSIKMKTSDIIADASNTRSYSSIGFGFDFEESDRNNQGGQHATSDTESVDEQDSDSLLSAPGSEHDVLSDGVRNERSFRVLYIQMEYCEKKTLRDVIDEGVDETEAWRLFRQILEGLAYIHNEGMIHRDLKPSNVFLDASGDVKIGDFGLAVLNQTGLDVACDGLASFDPCDTASLTSGVGTALYVSPEVATGQGTSARYNHKVDMYSLGIIFFELCHPFATAMERITVIRQLRAPDIVFPEGFPSATQQGQANIIRRLLNHSPEERPSSIQLLQDKALPPKLEDAYLQESMRTIARPDTPYYERLMSVLFSQNADRTTEYTFDANSGNATVDPLDALCYELIRERVTAVFRRHGAIELNTPLLLPKTNILRDKKAVDLMDNSGGLLPYDLTVPFARYVCRHQIQSVKRFIFGRVYRGNIVGGQPRVMREVDFDIVTPRLSNAAPDIEVICVTDEILDEIPPFQGTRCRFLLNHASVADVIFDYCRIPSEARADITAVLGLPGRSSSFQQACSQLTEQHQLPRSALDELVLFHLQGDLDDVTAKVSSMLNDAALKRRFNQAVDSLRALIDGAKQAGVQRRMDFAPLLTLNHHYYSGNFLFNAILDRKPGGIVAAGGRYDALLTHFRHPTMVTTAKQSHAVGVNFVIQKFVTAMVQYQREQAETARHGARRLEQDRRLGYWIPKRCDVYVASFGKGLLAERLSIARELWTHHISADVQYDDNLRSAGTDYLMQECRRQGVSWLVLAKRRGQEGRRNAAVSLRDAPMVKVKGVMRKVELELPRNELCTYLSGELADSRAAFGATNTGGGNIELGTGGGGGNFGGGSGANMGMSGDNVGSKDYLDSEGSNLNVAQMLVTVLHASDSSILQSSSRGSGSKLKHQQKQLIMDKAASCVSQVAGEIARGDVPILALDLTGPALKRLTQCNVRDADQFRRMVIDSLTTVQRDYLNTVREAMLRVVNEQGKRVLWLYSFRDDSCWLHRFGQ